MTPSALVPEELMTRFRSVAMERLTRIDAAWAGLVRGEADSEVERQLLRDVHTLKGDAKVVGLAEASLLCQRLEDLLAAARAKRYRVHEDVDIVVTMTIQFIAMLVRKRALGGGIDLHGFLKQIEEVMSEWLRRSSEAPDKRMSVGPHLRVKDHARVTVSSGLRLSTSSMAVFFEHLRLEGDPRARLHELWRDLLGGVEEAHRAAFDAIAQSHLGTARELAEEVGKIVDFAVQGETTLVGPETSDVLGVVLLHALRNAVDHGIEPANVRASAHKPKAGKVEVRLGRRGDRVELVVADDGGGIDIESVRARAVERGLLSADVAPHASDAEIVECLFAPGFSTRDATSDISGRGIGLDAAHAAVTEHGGRLRIETKRGKGTSTIATLPDTRGRIDVLVFEGLGAGVRFAVPATVAVRRSTDPPEVFLEDVLRLPRDRSRSPIALEVIGLPRRLVIAAGARPEPESALRRCVTPETELAEIVFVGGAEVVLVRPDHPSLRTKAAS